MVLSVKKRHPFFFVFVFSVVIAKTDRQTDRHKVMHMRPSVQLAKKKFYL